MPDLPGLHAGLSLVYKNTDHPDWAAAEQKREESLPAPDCATEPPSCAFLSGHFLEVVKTVPPNASPATFFWDTKAYNQLATQAFDRLNQLPESVQVHALKAQTFHDHRQNMEAANEWRAALNLSPADPNLKRQLSGALFDAKAYQSVMPLLKEQLAQDPKAPDLNYWMGASLWRTEQPEQALPYLELAVTGHPDNLAADAALGLALVALNKNAEAIPHLKKSPRAR